MPSNNILINGVLSYQVSDKKMPEFLRWLNQNSYDRRERTGNTPTKDKDIERIAISCSQPES